MKIKKTVIFLILMLLFFTFANPTYASNEATIKVQQNNTNLKTGDELSLSISVSNNSIQEEIYLICGFLDYDDTTFELETIDAEELDDDIVQIIEELADSEGIMMEILSVKDKWIIGNIKNEGNMLYIIYLGETGGIETGSTQEIGEIKLNVLDSAQNGIANIKITDMSVNEEIEISDDANLNFTISRTEDNREEQEIGQEEEQEQPQQQPQQQQQQQQQSTNQNPQQNQQEQSNKSNSNLVYTGAEDVIPYICITLVLSIVLYTKCRKYKQI